MSIAGTAIGLFIHVDAGTRVGHRVSEPGRAVLKLDGDALNGVSVFVGRADLVRVIAVASAALAEIDAQGIAAGSGQG